MEENKKYAEIEHSFTDVWAGCEVTFSFRIAKPTPGQIKMLQKQGGKDAAQASRNLLVGVIHPDDKDRFLASIEEYPGLTTSFAGVVMKSVGMADLGN